MSSPTGGPARPAPVLTEDNALFWDAATAHRLVVQRCSACHAFHHPPRPMCPHCHSTDLEFEAATGRGIVYSYAFLHHPRHPAFDYPVLAALVELDEGVRLMTNLVDVDPLDVRVGLPVEVTFADTAGGGVVPVFRPVSGEPGRGAS